jgi:hypothetical protein
MKELNGLIDNRNRQLFQDLSSVYEIDVQFGNCNDYSCFSKNNHSIIYVPNADKNPASFTHELLHIYLRTKSVFIGAGLKGCINDNVVLKNLFDDNLLEHIGNTLDHVKMLPLFTELGFDKADFITDYNQDKLTDSELESIKSKFNANWFFKSLYNKQAFKLFIGKFFAAKACPNSTFNYADKLSRLKSINQRLYEINEKFFNAWADFDINDTDPITGSYHILLFDYVEALENWTTNDNRR